MCLDKSFMRNYLKINLSETEMFDDSSFSESSSSDDEILNVLRLAALRTPSFLPHINWLNIHKFYSPENSQTLFRFELEDLKILANMLKVNLYMINGFFHFLYSAAASFDQIWGQVLY